MANPAPAAIPRDARYLPLSIPSIGWARSNDGVALGGHRQSVRLKCKYPALFCMELVQSSILVSMLHDVLNHMFHLQLPLLEKLLRPVIVYLVLIALLRVFGKRELAQLNPFDLIVLLSLSNTLQNAMIGEDNSLTGGLIGAFSLCAVNYAVVRFLFKHRRLDQWIEGKPTVLIKDGKIRPHALARELLSLSE